MKFNFYCYQILEIMCCTSCHDDQDSGYDQPMETELSKTTFHHCCATQNLDRKTLAKYIHIARQIKAKRSD